MKINSRNFRHEQWRRDTQRRRKMWNKFLCKILCNEKRRKSFGSRNLENYG